MSVRSGTATLQALIGGRLRDSVTGGPPRVPVGLRLIDRNDNDEVRLGRTLTPDGRFAFFGDPERAFPRFATEALALRIEATAPRFADADLDVDIAATADQPATIDVPMPPPAESPAPARLMTAGLPTTDLELVLEPLPVRLAGRVVVSNQPAVGVAGAELDLGGGITTTADAEGHFAFADPLALVESVDLDVTAAGFVTRTVHHELVYDRPVNQLIIPLRRS